MFPVANPQPATLFNTGPAKSTRGSATSRRFAHPSPDEPDVTLEYQFTPGCMKPHMIVRTVAFSFPKTWHFAEIQDARAKWMEIETEMRDHGYEGIS